VTIHAGAPRPSPQIGKASEHMHVGFVFFVQTLDLENYRDLLYLSMTTSTVTSEVGLRFYLDFMI